MIFQICALASSSGWECSACTLVNSSSDQLCSACERWVGYQPKSNFFCQVRSLPCLVSHLFAHLKHFSLFRLKSFENKSYFRPRQPEEDKFPPSKPGNWVCKVAVWFCLTSRNQKTLQEYCKRPNKRLIEMTRCVLTRTLNGNLPAQCAPLPNRSWKVKRRAVLGWWDLSRWLWG